MEDTKAGRSELMRELSGQTRPGCACWTRNKNKKGTLEGSSLVGQSKVKKVNSRAFVCAAMQMQAPHLKIRAPGRASCPAHDSCMPPALPERLSQLRRVLYGGGQRRIRPSTGLPLS